MDRLVSETGLETRRIPGNRMGLASGACGRERASRDYPFRLPLSWGARLSFVRAGLRLRAAAQGHVAPVSPSGRDGDRKARPCVAHRDDQSFAAYLGDLHPDVAAIFRAISERVTAEPEQISAGCGAALFALVWGDDRRGRPAI